MTRETKKEREMGEKIRERWSEPKFLFCQCYLGKNGNPSLGGWGDDFA